MSRVQAWERRSEVPLLLLALAFLGAWAWPILDPRIGSDAAAVCDAIGWAVWAAFAVDFVIRLHLAEERRRYALSHWYDIALIGLPMLRPLRLLRVLALARVLNRTVAGSVAGRVSVYVAGTAVMSVGLGAVSVLDAEQGAKGANITTFGDALWWAMTTTTTVGYGDRYPVTAEGRIVATVLMLVGIAVVGSITGAVAAWLVEQVDSERKS